MAAVGEERDAPGGVEAHQRPRHELGERTLGERGDVELGFLAPVVAGDHARQHRGVELARVRRDKRKARAVERLLCQRTKQHGVRMARPCKQHSLHVLRRFASSRLRNSLRWTLPVVVIGSASMNSISRGYS